MLSGLLLVWTLTLLYGGGSNLAIVKYTPANAQVLCNHYIEMCCRCRTAVGSNAQHIVNALNVDRRNVAALRKLCRGISQDFRYGLALFLRVACNQQIVVVEAVFTEHIFERKLGGNLVKRCNNGVCILNINQLQHRYGAADFEALHHVF